MDLVCGDALGVAAHETVDVGQAGAECGQAEQRVANGAEGW
jgi:hypothetical protein